MLALTRSEFTKLTTSRAVWVLAAVAVLAGWPMALSNAAPTADLPPDSDLFFSSTPIPLEYQGFEMAGFGYVLIVALAAIWAGNEFGSGRQVRTTLLATPRRLRVYFAKAALLAAFVALLSVLVMGGSIVITHATGSTGVDPVRLSPEIWAHIGGLTLAWTLTALITFSIGVLARSAILPLVLIVPLVIGIGDFLSSFWSGAKYLPTTAGAALYNDPSSGGFLPPAEGALVQAIWAAIFVGAAATVFVRRDV